MDLIFQELRMAPTNIYLKGFVMHNNCSICDSTGVSVCLVNDHQIDVCKKCGGIYVPDFNMIVQMQMPLQVDNDLYAVSLAMSTLYKHIHQMGMSV